MKTFWFFLAGLLGGLFALAAVTAAVAAGVAE
jgi:hypothetical protein